MKKHFVVSGAILGGIGVVLGAMGAHMLKDILSENSLASFNTGVRYQIYHAFFMLIVGFTSVKLNYAKGIYWLVLIGTIFFSLSIYLLNLGANYGVNVKFLGPITPLGGILLISAWFLLAYSALKEKD